MRTGYEIREGAAILAARRTTWEACPPCGATTRHDDGLCIRDPRHPHFDVRLAPALLGTTEQVAAQHGVAA